MNAHGTVREEDYFRENAVKGSLKLRNALFKFAGYRVPRVGKPRKPVAPTFVAPQPKRGRPSGAPNKPKAQHAKIEIVKQLVSDHTGVGCKQMSGKKRRADILHARHVAMYAARKALGASYPVIGKHFGRRDHSTVIHAVRCIEIRILEGDIKTILALKAVKEGLGK